MDTAEEIIANLPLTEVSYFILLSLNHGPRHGYLIMKDVRGMSQDRVVLSTGTLYGALKRMLEAGWVDRMDGGEEEVNSGRVRKEYQISHLGLRLLNAEIQRLEALLIAARLRPVKGSL